MNPPQTADPLARTPGPGARHVRRSSREAGRGGRAVVAAWLRLEPNLLSWLDPGPAALGPLLDTPYFRSTGRDMIYMNGPEREAFALDSAWLLIWIDESGRFARFRIAID